MHHIIRPILSLCGYQLYPRPPLPRQQWGSSGDLPVDLQNIVSPQPADPRPTPSLCGEIFPSKGLEIYYPRQQYYMYLHICQDPTKITQGYVAGTYPGISRKMSPAVSGSTWGCTLDNTRYKIESLGKSLLSPFSGGARVTIDNHITKGLVLIRK